MGAYPAAYRRQTANRIYQVPTGKAPRGFQTPLPGNLNTTRDAPRVVPRGPLDFGRRARFLRGPIGGGVGGGWRLFTRAIPYLGLAITAYELYRWYIGRDEAEFRMPPGTWYLKYGTWTRSFYGGRYNPGGGWMRLHHLNYHRDISGQAISDAGYYQRQWGTIDDTLPGINISPSTPRVGMWTPNDATGSSRRWAHYRTYERIPGAAYNAADRPTWYPPRPASYVTVPQPSYPSWVDPFLMPIGQPVPTPEPAPYPVIPRRQLNPERDPVEQTTVGPANDPLTRPTVWTPSVRPLEVPVVEWTVTMRPRPSETTVPVVPTLPGEPGTITEPVTEVLNPTAPAPGTAIPVVGTSTRTDTDTDAKQKQRNHNNTRPRSRTKERKVIANAHARSLIARVVNAVTESNDAIEALYFALPKKHWRRHHNPYEKALTVYRHIDELDVNLAIHNLAMNQLEDFAIGKIAGKGQELARPILETTGRPVGLTTGPAL